MAYLKSNGYNVTAGTFNDATTLGEPTKCVIVGSMDTSNIGANQRVPNMWNSYGFWSENGGQCCIGQSVDDSVSSNIQGGSYFSTTNMADVRDGSGGIRGQINGSQIATGIRLSDPGANTVGINNRMLQFGSDMVANSFCGSGNYWTGSRLDFEVGFKPDVVFFIVGGTPNSFIANIQGSTGVLARDRWTGTTGNSERSRSHGWYFADNTSPGANYGSLSSQEYVGLILNDGGSVNNGMTAGWLENDLGFWVDSFGSAPNKMMGYLAIQFMPFISQRLVNLNYQSGNTSRDHTVLGSPAIGAVEFLADWNGNSWDTPTTTGMSINHALLADQNFVGGFPSAGTEFADHLMHMHMDQSTNPVQSGTLRGSGRQIMGYDGGLFQASSIQSTSSGYSWIGLPNPPRTMRGYSVAWSVVDPEAGNISLGFSPVKGMFLGNNPVRQVYRGSDLIYSY